MIIVEFDIVAVVVTVILFISNNIRGIRKERTNRLFNLILVLNLLAVLGDLASAIGNNTFTGTRQEIILMYVFNYIYFFFHTNMMTVFFMYCFSAMGIWYLIKRHKWIRYILLLFTAIENILILLNFYNKKIFSINDKAAYVRGDYLKYLYILTFLIIIVGTYTLVRYSKMIRRDKFYVLLCIAPVYSIALILQNIYANLTIEMYTLSVELILFFFVVQKDEEYVDPISGAKKYTSGIETLKRILYTETPTTIVLVKFVNHKNIRLYLGQISYNEFLKMVSEEFYKIAKEENMTANVYYLESGLFAYVCEKAEAESVLKAAKKIRRFSESNLLDDDYEVYADARICVVNCPEDVNDYNTLISFITNFHKSMPETRDILYFADYKDSREFSIKNEINEIIERSVTDNQFEIHYQPVYSVKEKKYVAAEALIRLHDIKYGDISPATFIPAAETNGSMHRIGRFVLEEVFSFISRHDLDSLGIKYLHINLSSSQCIEVNLVKMVKELIEKYKINPEKISLEITESAADFEPLVVDQNVKELSEYGINFALDDYGTGYSNIKRLTELPVSLVKLDKSFAENIEDDSMKIIIEDTVKMLKKMGKKVLIEGVETESFAKKFEKIGCDYMQGSTDDGACEYMQGYFFSKALPESEFIEFIKKENSIGK